MAHEQASVPILDYAPMEARPRYRFLPALLLCLPGILCWVVFLTNTWPLGATGLMVLWGMAIITAIVSLFVYGRRWREPKPWYVHVCVAFNILGLAFTCLILRTFA